MTSENNNHLSKPGLKKSLSTPNLSHVSSMDSKHKSTLIKEQSLFSTLASAESLLVKSSNRLVGDTKSNLVPMVVQPSHSLHAFSEAQILLEKLADQLLNEMRLDKSKKNAILLSMTHVLKESADIMFWASLASEKKSIIVHYKNSLFETMRHLAKKSPRYNKLQDNDALSLDSTNIQFTPGELLHVQDVAKLKPDQKNVISHKRFIDDRNKTPKPVNIANGMVYIPICTGYDEGLKGNDLQSIINTYLALGIQKVYIYLGRYDNDDKPESDLAKKGESKRQEWLQKNEKYIPNDKRVEIITRQQFTASKRFQLSETLAEEIFLTDKVVQDSIINYVKKFYNRPNKHVVNKAEDPKLNIVVPRPVLGNLANLARSLQPDTGSPENSSSPPDTASIASTLSPQPPMGVSKSAPPTCGDPFREAVLTSLADSYFRSTNPQALKKFAEALKLLSVAPAFVPFQQVSTEKSDAEKASLLSGLGVFSVQNSLNGDSGTLKNTSTASSITSNIKR